MAWLRPYDFRDPDGGWSDEELAFDGDIETRAKHVDFTTYPRAMSGWLELLVDRVVAARLRVFWQNPGSTLMYWVDVYDGQTWVPVVVKQNFRGTDWYETEFPEQVVTRIRVRWAHYGARPPGYGPAEVVIEGGCPGLLAPICAIFHKIGDFFSGLADRIDDIMFVGDALAAPFVDLAQTWHELGDACCEVSAALQEILDLLEGGITWDEIEAFVQGLIPTLPGWLEDPTGWFLVQLTLAFDLEPYHTQSLEFLAKWVLEEYFPILYHLWLDSDAWIEEHVLSLIPVLPDWLQDPEAWLRLQVEAIIGELAEDVSDFLDNAWGWLLDQYEDAFESISARLYGLAERTLRFFFEGVW